MGRPPGPEAGPRDHGRPRRGGNLDGRPSGCERVIVLHHRDFLLDNSNRKQQTVITALHLSLLLGLSWLAIFVWITKYSFVSSVLSWEVLGGAGTWGSYPAPSRP